jgi:hypothetical protein
MLRELSTLLLDLQESIADMQMPAMSKIDMRLNGLSIDVPIDVQLMFSNGGVVMLADVARSRYGAGIAVQKSRLIANFEVLPYVDESNSEAIL